MDSLPICFGFLGENKILIGMSYVSLSGDWFLQPSMCESEVVVDIGCALPHDMLHLNSKFQDFMSKHAFKNDPFVISKFPSRSAASQLTIPAWDATGR